MKKVKPREQGGEGGPSHLAPVDSRILSSCPNVIAHCAVTRFDDGTARQPGFIQVQTQGQGWLIRVKDPDSGCSFPAVGATLDDAFAMADMLLGSDECPWEQDRYLGGKQGPQKKKA